MTRFTIFDGNAYDVVQPGEAVCVTTNGEIKANGRAVMGRGCAEYVAKTFPGTADRLAALLKQYGNRAFNLGSYHHNGNSIRIISFPTKNKWRDNSSLPLIRSSAEQLVGIADKFGLQRIYVPIPGCTNGKLVWSRVKQELSVLDERFVIYSIEPNLFQF